MNLIRKANSWLKLYNIDTKTLSLKEKLAIYFLGWMGMEEMYFKTKLLEIERLKKDLFYMELDHYYKLHPEHKNYFYNHE